MPSVEITSSALDIHKLETIFNTITPTRRRDMYKVRSHTVTDGKLVSVTVVIPGDQYVDGKDVPFDGDVYVYEIDKAEREKLKKKMHAIVDGKYPTYILFSDNDPDEAAAVFYIVINDTLPVEIYTMGDLCYHMRKGNAMYTVVVEDNLI